MSLLNVKHDLIDHKAIKISKTHKFEIKLVEAYIQLADTLEVFVEGLDQGVDELEDRELVLLFSINSHHKE